MARGLVKIAASPEVRVDPRAVVLVPAGHKPQGSSLRPPVGAPSLDSLGVAQSASADAADKGSRVKIELGKADRGLVRATITSPSNAEVSWSIRFKTEKAASPVAFGGNQY